MSFMAMQQRVFDPYHGFRPTTSGILIPTRVGRWSKPIGFDCFSGAGGFSLGVIQAGFQIVGAADNDAWATITYLHNLGADHVTMHFATPRDEQRFTKAVEKACFPKRNGVFSRMIVSGGNRRPEYNPGVQHFFFGDIRSWSGKEMLDLMGLAVGELDVVFGGPPCQGFSNAGKRDVMDPRNSLVFAFAERVIAMQPKSMVMENVPGILSMVTPEGINVVHALCLMLEQGGMGTYDALKRALVGHPDARAVVKHPGVSRTASATTPAKPPASAKTPWRPVQEQAKLFE